MNTPKDPHNKDTANHEDDLIGMPGASVIDIGELRRQQSMEYDESLELSDSDSEESTEETTLDEEARLLREELENDPEMQKDVLEGYSADSSNENLENIANAVTEQQLKDLEHMEVLASEVSDEMKMMNEVFIEEDKLLESKIAHETAMDLASNDEDDVETEDMSEEDAALKAALPQKDENGEYNLEDLQSCIEAILFYSDRSVSLKKLKDMLEMTDAEDAPFLAAIEQLKASYQSKAHGFEVAEIAGGYQLRTKPSKAPLLRKLAKVQIQRLSRGAMETLTIVAYKQPCTKDDIDQVRGVDSSHFIRTLLDRKLVEVSGRSEAAGRPMIYSTTDTFMEVFGLMNLAGLPPLREIEAMVPQMAAADGGEDPRILQMRKMVLQMKTEANHLDYNAREDEQILQEIKDRVKSIDITSPYLVRQKALADEGIVGDEAEAMLAKEFGFDRASSGGEAIASTEEHAHTEEQTHSEEQLSLESTRDIQTDLNADFLAMQDLGHDEHHD